MVFQVQGLFPDRSVAELVGRAWQLRARCGACGRERRWSAAELRTAFPPETTVSAIRARLACADCGAREGLIDILQDHVETARRDVERNRREAAGERSAG
jgi:hypothetical protein